MNKLRNAEVSESFQDKHTIRVYLVNAFITKLQSCYKNCRQMVEDTLSKSIGICCCRYVNAMYIIGKLSTVLMFHFNKFTTKQCKEREKKRKMRR